MNSLTTYGRNTKIFHFGKTDYCYSYRIPIIKNRGANYNSGYREGYQRALRDLERCITNYQEIKGFLFIKKINTLLLNMMINDLSKKII